MSKVKFIAIRNCYIEHKNIKEGDTILFEKEAGEKMKGILKLAENEVTDAENKMILPKKMKRKLKVG